VAGAAEPVVDRSRRSVGRAGAGGAKTRSARWYRDFWRRRQSHI